jgi:hypothetical protein
MSIPQFTDLVNSLADDGPSIAPLAAWLVGEPVTPADVYDCLQVACRARAGDNDGAHQLIDLACRELERRFPEELSPA